MAISQIWDVKTNTGETLSYIARFDKSDHGALVFSHHCSNIPELANIQMKAHRQRFGKNSKNLLYHGFVSFKRDEIDRATAYKFAKMFMQRHFGEYQYFGSVHVDTKHIHFNFAINAVALDGHKYNDCNTTLASMRAEVDRCCDELGLSIVIPKGIGVSYKEWKEQQNDTSWKSQIKIDIDLAIDKAETFEEFLTIMRSDGYFIKQGANVMHMVVRKEGMERGCRVRKIGVAYTEEAIKKRIQFKEFNYIPSILRKPKKQMKPVEKELMRIFYRKPSLSTSVAMGIHLLNSYVTGNRHKILRYSPPKQKTVYSRYKEQVKKLSEQMNYCSEHQIKTREELQKRIVLLENEVVLNNDKELKKELKKCREIEKSLDDIKERDIVENFEKQTEKDSQENEKVQRNKER